MPMAFPAHARHLYAQYRQPFEPPLHLSSGRRHHINGWCFELTLSAMQALDALPLTRSYLVETGDSLAFRITRGHE
jgi:hypothetical protein